MTRTLYDLAGRDRSMRFSPFCWRIKLALKHKGLGFDEVDVSFTEKDRIAFSGQNLVPILTDGSQTITDSWNIALYLDETYNDLPPLMDGPQARAYALTIKHWVETAIHLPVIKIVLLDLYDRLSPADQTYFRESREARFGMTLEDFCIGENGVPALQSALRPARMSLSQLPYLGGDEPGFADHVLMGALLWGRASSDIPLIAADDQAMRAWLDRIAERYGHGLKV